MIGIENNKPECIDLLCQKSEIPEYRGQSLPSVYGTGAELILIEKCLGREGAPWRSARRCRHCGDERHLCVLPGQVPGYRYAGGGAHHYGGWRCLRCTPEPGGPRRYCL